MDLLNASGGTIIYYPFLWNYIQSRFPRPSIPRDVVETRFTLTPYIVTDESVLLSLQFLPVSLRMPRRTTTLTLLDTAGKSCRATWVVTSSGKRLSAGWRRFALDHKLAVGDVCIFEVTNVDDLTLLVHVFRGRTDVKCNEPSTDVPSRGNLLSVDQRMQSRSVVAKSGKSGVAFVSQRRSVTRTERERAKQEAQAEALKSKNPTAVVVMRHSSVYQYFIVVRYFHRYLHLTLCSYHNHIGVYGVK